MADIRKEQEREELHKAIWGIDDFYIKVRTNGIAERVTKRYRMITKVL